MGFACSLRRHDSGAAKDVTVGLTPNTLCKRGTTKHSTMMHCKSKPPGERPTDVMAALDTAGAATAGKGSTYQYHRRFKAGERGEEGRREARNQELASYN